MEVRKPIFIVGTGRSGSTIFHEMFCRHPEVAWISKLCDVFPNQVWLNKYFLNSLDFPVVGTASKYLILQKRAIRPSEAYNFWENICTGFSRPCRDLVAEDVTNKKKRKIRKELTKTLTSNRERLLIKITGWPRLSFLQEVFEDAKFIHIVRDGRATVNSMLEVDFWEGWQGPQNWRWGELTLSQKADWDKYDKSFAALAAIEMNILMDAMEEAKTNIGPKSFLEVKYEDLCASPRNTFKDVIEFCDLTWSANFSKTIEEFNLKNTNYKWKQDLTPAQCDVISQILTSYLKKYNYEQL